MYALGTWFVPGICVWLPCIMETMMMIITITIIITNPPSHRLNITNCNNQEIQRSNHLLYMDDINLYAATDKQIQGLLQLTQTFSRDIKMSFGIEKCKTLRIAKGKLEMGSFTTENDGTMEAMNEDDIYKYLDHTQTKQMKRTQMEQKLGEE